MKNHDHMPAAPRRSRISLGMVMMAILSVFCLTHPFVGGQAEAAVTALDAWSEVYSANPAATSGTLTSNNFTVSAAGSNKLLAVGICWEFGTTGTMQINSGTLSVRLDNASGAQFTAIGLTSVAGAEHCYAGYLPESQFTSGTHAIYVSWAATTTTTNCSALSVMVGTYQGVDQTTTINSTAANNANTATIALGSAVSYLANSVTLFVTANGGTGLTTVTKTAPNFTQQLVGATALHSPFIADAANASAGSYPGTDTITFSGATARNRAAVVAGALNPALASAAGSIQLSASTYSVAENGGTVTITATRTGGSTGIVGISYATSNGTATAGSDYTAASGTLSWANGDTANKTFTVSITDDVAVEGNETFNVTLSGPTGGATLGTPSAATVTITDNDVASAGSIQLSGSGYSINENAGTVTITATRTGGSAGAVGISYATSNGTATAGSDYTAASGTLSWADGDTANKTFTVSITDDVAVESNETFNVTLSGPTGGATLGTPSAATVTILDNDGAPAAVPAGNWPVFGMVMTGIVVYGLLWRRKQGDTAA